MSFKNRVVRSLAALCVALGATVGGAQAAQKVLIISTNETQADAVSAIANAQTEFTLAGSLPTRLKILGTPGAVTPATFVSADGSPFDLVVVMSVYTAVAQDNMEAITTAINTRAANMFAMFIDGCGSCGSGPGPGSNARLWVPELNKVTSGTMKAGLAKDFFFDSSLNGASPYSPSFTGLNPLVAGYITEIDNVPAANVLYLPPGVTSVPSGATSTAFGVFFPGTETGGAANMGGGACLFGAVDATLMAQSYSSNQGRFAPAMLKAAATPDCAFPSVQKAFNPAQVGLGGTSTLTITLSNPRDKAVGQVKLTDNLPPPLTVAGLASTTCVGGTLSAPVAGNAISLTDAQIPAGAGTVPGTCTITVPVLWNHNPAGQNACAAAPSPTNSANPVTNTITPPSQFSTVAGQMGTPAVATLACNPAAAPVLPQVSVKKTAGSAVLTPGGTMGYTIVVTNTGTVHANGTQVSDPAVAGLTPVGWTCVAVGGAACGSPAGTGALADTIATLPAGATVTYTVNATVSANPPAVVVNTATITPGNGGICAPGDPTAPCASSASVPPVPQVGISKSANTAVLAPGGQAVFTVRVSNTGAVAASDALVSDPLPAGITAMAWTCAGACPSASGTGALNETIASLPAGATLTYTITATVAANPPASVVNTASVLPGKDGVCTPGNSGAPCTATASVPPAAAGPVTPVPTLGQWGLMLLSLLLAALGLRARHARG